MQANRLFGLTVAALAAAFLILLVPGVDEPVQAATASDYFTVGARFFPYVAGGLCLVLGLLLGLSGGLGAHAPAERGAELRRLLNVGLFMAIATIYPLTWEALGFLPATALALLVLLLAFGARSAPTILGVVVLVPVVLGWVFGRMMGVVLPDGPLGLGF